MKITEVNYMLEIMLPLVSILIAVTVGASVEYYKQIRRAQKEYEKAREALKDIILSFNRELKQEADRLEFVAYEVEGNNGKVNTALRMINNIKEKNSHFETKLAVISDNNASILSKIKEVYSKTQNIEEVYKMLKVKMKEIEEQMQKLSAIPETLKKPVMPIRRDKAMAALTETEVTVLELLSAEGLKTAPEIKERLKLSREHTARLMKKLYEKGYLERETGKIPFRYSVKKEMKKFLKTVENEHI